MSQKKRKARKGGRWSVSSGAGKLVRLGGGGGGGVNQGGRKKTGPAGVSSGRGGGTGIEKVEVFVREPEESGREEGKGSLGSVEKTVGGKAKS